MAKPKPLSRTEFNQMVPKLDKFVTSLKPAQQKALARPFAAAAGNPKSHKAIQQFLDVKVGNLNPHTRSIAAGVAGIGTKGAAAGVAGIGTSKGTAAGVAAKKSKGTAAGVAGLGASKGTAAGVAAGVAGKKSKGTTAGVAAGVAGGKSKGTTAGVAAGVASTGGTAAGVASSGNPKDPDKNS